MTKSTKENKTLSLNEIIEFRNEILKMHRRTGETIEACGAFIEAEMDGTQPEKLIEEAVASAKANSVSKILRVKREMYIRNAILIEMHRTEQTVEEAASWIEEICDDVYKPHMEAGKQRAIADQGFALDTLMDEDQDPTA